MKQKDIWDLSFIVLFISLVITLLFYISFFGAPLTDESFPIATSLRFLQGQKPFIDDISPYMPIGLLLYPLAKLSTIIHQGKNDLILFFRHSFLIFSFFINTYIFFLLKKNLSPILSFFIALMIFIFHPFGLNNFHYDTLSVLLWSAIIFQLYSFQFLEKIKKRDLIIFSLFHLGLCFSYPSFCFFFLPFYLVYFFFSCHIKQILISHLVMGTLSSILIIWVIFFYFHVQLDDIKKALVFTQNLFHLSDNHQGISYKALVVIKQLIAQYKIQLGIACGLLILASCFSKFKFILVCCFFFILLLPLYNFSIQQIRYSETFYCLVYWGFLSFPIFLLFLRDDSKAKKLMLFVGLPSLAAGLLTSTTSYNKELNFILGFFPASILAYVYIYFVLQKSLNNSSFSYVLTRGILIIGILQMSFFQWNYIYGIATTGKDLYKNTLQIKLKGPFHNLRVEPYSYELLKELQNEIHLIDTSTTNHFIYFGIFSAGYLFVNYLKPGDYLLYTSYRLGHFGAEIKTPCYVFDFSKLFHFKAEDIVAYLNGSSYKKIKSRKYYDLYRATNIQEKMAYSP